MAIEFKTTTPPKEIKSFPKVMKHKQSGTLFYFYEEGFGTPIGPIKLNWDYTYAHNNPLMWCMKHFEDYNLNISIQNL